MSLKNYIGMATLGMAQLAKMDGWYMPKKNTRDWYKPCTTHKHTVKRKKKK